MLRLTVRVTLTAVAVAVSASSSFAQQPGVVGTPEGVRPVPVAPANTMPQPPSPLGGAGALPPTHLVQPGYPYLNAPLYPSPVPHVPNAMGRTVITNQALSPHEMLYPHTYRALYPPYYHKVRGHWVVGLSGVRWREDWYLQGTEVKVKYNSHISPFAFFHPPMNGHHRNSHTMGWSTGGFLGID